jgi:hypothetical protein
MVEDRECHNNNHKVEFFLSLHQNLPEIKFNNKFMKYYNKQLIVIKSLQEKTKRKQYKK